MLSVNGNSHWITMGRGAKQGLAIVTGELGLERSIEVGSSSKGALIKYGGPG